MATLQFSFLSVIGKTGRFARLPYLLYMNTLTPLSSAITAAERDIVLNNLYDRYKCRLSQETSTGFPNLSRLRNLP